MNEKNLKVHSNPNNSLLSISIITLMYSVSGFYLFDLYTNRSVVVFISLFFTVLFGYKYFFFGMKKPLGPQALLIASTLIAVIFHFYDISYIMDAFASFFIVILLNRADIRLTDKILAYLIRITTILCAIGLILFTVTCINPDLVEQIGYWKESTHPLRFLGSVITGYEFWGFNIPRSSSFTYEPSFLPAYMGIPFAFLLNIKSRYFEKFIILSFLLLSLAGSIYLFFSLAILSYFAMKFFSKRIFMALLICCVPIYFYILMVYVTPLVPSIDDAGIIINDVSRAVSEDYSNDRFVQHRASSTAIRLGLISWGLHTALENPLGVNETLRTVNGLLIYSFITAGIFGLILSINFYKYVLDQIYSFNIAAKLNIKMQVASALLMGLCIQAFLINDYGFSNVHGMVLLALMLRKISDVSDNQSAS